MYKFNNLVGIVMKSVSCVKIYHDKLMLCVHIMNKFSLDTYI